MGISIMKKILFIMLILAAGLQSLCVFAEGYVTEQEFIMNAYSLLKCENAEDYSSAISAFSEFNIIDENDLLPEEYITHEEAAVILAKIFCVRCGETLAPARATFLYDYFDISIENRKYINTAAAIGALYYYSNQRFAPKRYVSEDIAEEIIENTRKSIENLIKTAGIESAVNITDEYGITNKIKAEKNIFITVSINDTSNLPSDSILLISIITKNDKIDEVKMKMAENIGPDSFCTVADKINCGQTGNNSQLDIYIWDGAKMIPLKKKYVLK